MGAGKDMTKAGNDPEAYENKSDSSIVMNRLREEIGKALYGVLRRPKRRIC